MATTPTTPSGQPLQMQPGETQLAAPSHVVTWQNKRIPPPSPLYVDVDDLLNAGAASSQAGELVTINYRLLRAADGVIIRGQFTVTPGASRAVGVQQEQLAEGFLLSVSCKAAVATTRGQTFVRIFVGSGAYGAGQPSYMLMSDYVTTAMAPAFPNGRQVTPVEGPGALVLVNFTPSGSGATPFVTVPANTRWRVQSMNGSLTTGGAAGTRVVRLQSVVGSQIVFMSTAGTGQGPGSTKLYTFFAGGTVQDDSVPEETNALPDNYVIGGQAVAGFSMQTVGIQSADQWTSAYALVEEWLDNV